MTQHINLPNCIVAQSGGPTVAINASLVASSAHLLDIMEQSTVRSMVFSVF